LRKELDGFSKQVSDIVTVQASALGATQVNIFTHHPHLVLHYRSCLSPISTRYDFVAHLRIQKLIMARKRPTETTDSRTIPVVEEQLRIDTEQVETGTIRVKKEIHEKQVIVDGSISHDEMHVRRVPVNQVISVAPPPVRYEGDTMIISVLQEELVLQKRLVLVEEVHVTKTKISKSVEEPVTLKREEVIVEKDAAPGAGLG
jgi:uncharacterized protein (TIGR02271 family)